jgi:hypothetical protein
MGKRRKSRRKGCLKKGRGRKNQPKGLKKPVVGTVTTVIEGPDYTVPIQTHGKSLQTSKIPPTSLVRKEEYINVYNSKSPLMWNSKPVIEMNRSKNGKKIKLTGVKMKKYMDTPFTVHEQLQHLKSVGHNTKQNNLAYD